MPLEKVSPSPVPPLASTSFMPPAAEHTACNDEGLTTAVSTDTAMNSTNHVSTRRIMSGLFRMGCIAELSLNANGRPSKRERAAPSLGLVVCAISGLELLPKMTRQDQITQGLLDSAV